MTQLRQGDIDSSMACAKSADLVKQLLAETSKVGKEGPLAPSIQQVSHIPER